MAAIVCYLGPFGPALRTELLGKWRLLCQTGGLDPEPQDPRAPLFTHSETSAPDPPPWTGIPLAERLEGPCLGRWGPVHTGRSRPVTSWW